MLMAFSFTTPALRHFEKLSKLKTKIPFDFGGPVRNSAFLAASRDDPTRTESPEIDFASVTRPPVFVDRDFHFHFPVGAVILCFVCINRLRKVSCPTIYNPKARFLCSYARWRKCIKRQGEKDTET